MQVPTNKEICPMNDHLKKEIERKFIVAPQSMPSLATAKYVNCRSGFIQDIDGVNVIRLREEQMIRNTPTGVEHLGKRYFISTKFEDGLVRTKMEFEIDEATFKNHCSGLQSAIQKKRYWLPYGDKTIEIDVFEGNRLSGMIIAEVKFASTEEANDFVAPIWFGKEVTEDPFYSGRNLGGTQNFSEMSNGTAVL
jgi:adenylate cyclase